MDEAILFGLITRRTKARILSPQPEKHLISPEIRCFFYILF